MAKRAKAGELDESLIIQSFKNTELLADPTNAIASKPVTETISEASEEIAGVPEAELPVSEPVPKGKTRRRKGNYDEVFLKKKELKTRQPVYISLDIHLRIKNVIQWLALAGKEISVGGYIDNVLADHLEQHKDEIDELKRSQLENS